MIADYLEQNPVRARGVAYAEQEGNIAQLVYDLRTGRGLTQAQFAKLVGTTQPVIARLEDADYQGHSLKMLNRIAFALELDLVIQLRPKPKATKKRATAKRAAKATPKKTTRKRV